jgi:hypothetical protein
MQHRLSLSTTRKCARFEKNPAKYRRSVLVLVALIEFIPSPRKALRSISEVLSTNVRMEGNHLVLHRTEQNSTDRVNSKTKK